MTSETLNTGTGEQEVMGFMPKTAEPSGPERGDTPLKDFWMKPAGFTVLKGMSQKGREWIRVNFRGTDVEVIEADVPYPYPTSEFGMFYSDPTTTPKPRAGQGSDEWSVLCESLRQIYGGDREDMMNVVWGGQVSKEDTQPPFDCPRLHMVKVPTLLQVGPDDSNSKWHPAIVPAWKVVEIEGVGKLDEAATNGVDANGSNGNGSVDLSAHMLNMADGKTEDQFNAEATNDPLVMSNPSVMTQIGDKVFLSNMVMLGLLTKDTAGVFHKKS